MVDTLVGESVGTVIVERAVGLIYHRGSVMRINKTAFKHCAVSVATLIDIEVASQHRLSEAVAKLNDLVAYEPCALSPRHLTHMVHVEIEHQKLTVRWECGGSVPMCIS